MSGRDYGSLTREQLEAALADALDRLKHESALAALLFELATDFINLPASRFDASIDNALGRLADLIGADRAYVFSYHFDELYCRNTHEWCGNGIAPQKDELQHLDLQTDNPWVQAHRAGATVRIDDTDHYPDQWVREVLQTQGVRSLISVPLVLADHCIGFVGFDAVRTQRVFSRDEERLLNVFAEMLVNVQLRFDSGRLLERERRRLNDIIEGTGAGTWEWEVDSGRMYFNVRWLDILGLAEMAALPSSNSRWAGLIHPDDRIAGEAAVKSHFQGRTAFFEREMRVRHADGHWVWIYMRGRSVGWDAAGRVRLFSGIALDVSERKRAEQRLALAASVFTHSHEGILITDAENRIVEVNEAFTRITGYSRQEVLGRDPAFLRSDRHDAGHFELLWQALGSQGYWHGELWNRDRSGREFVEELTISVVRNEQGDVVNYVGLFSDITNEKAHQELLERNAYFDPLTGLPNRVLLSDRIRQAMLRARRDGQRMAVAYVDLDGFKAINDEHGHDFGDLFLCRVADRLRARLRNEDTVARLGGDEFVVVLQDIDDQTLNAMIDRLASALRKPLKVEGRRLSVTASIGVTLYPQEVDIDADQLVRQADQAMYEAKRRGRHRVFLFDSALESRLQKHGELLNRLREALQHDAFELHYQPRVDLASGGLVGVEALLRWRQPDGSLLLPAEFLPDIEGDDFILELGQWVIDRALADTAAWHAKGLQLTIGVNLAARQLLQADFAEQLARSLAAHPQCSPGSLLLEILETSVLEDLERATSSMHACKALGVEFALDDFGTGYSSLRYLKHLPISQLKIDLSFVRDMLVDREDQTIVEGIIQLGRAFELEVVAEGVEGPEHAARLLAMGCHGAQGYGIARPMPASELAAWIARWQPAWLARAPAADTDGRKLA